MKLLNFVLSAVVLLWACSEETFVPKPKGYHRIELPPHQYQNLVEAHPYRFQYSKYAVARLDSSFLVKPPFQAQPDWIVVKYPEAFSNAEISITYKKVHNDWDSVVAFFNTSHRLTNKHTLKASAIEELMTKTPNGITAIVQELEGDVPNHLVFYATDTTKHFIRAAMYLPSSTKNDSLAPIIEYIKIDVIHLLNTLQWEK